MPTAKRLWTDYPRQYAALAKEIAMAAPPTTRGPFESKSEALHYRSAFWRFREALRGSLASPSDGTYPARLYEILSMLSISVTRAPEDPNLWNVVFDLDPLIKDQERTDPASRQIRELAHASFIAAQQPTRGPAFVSEPIFTDEQFEERRAAILDGHKQ